MGAERKPNAQVPGSTERDQSPSAVENSNHVTPKVLLGVTRQELESLFRTHRDELAAKHIEPPDPSLPEEPYLDRAEPVLKSLGIPMWRSGAVVPATSPPPGLTNPPVQKSTNPTQSPGRFSLRKGLGYWTLIHGDQQAIIKHERGMFYVAWLLEHPNETIHALDLVAKIPEFYRQHLALTEIVNPETGKQVTLESHARLQERSLSLDDAQAMRALLREQKELEAILDDPDQDEPVKAEALHELEQIVEFQKKHIKRTRDTAQRAAHSVQVAIGRFHHHLKTSGNSLLVEFADHIEKYILVPSRRFSGHGNQHARSGLAGRLSYEPPPALSLNLRIQTPRNPDNPQFNK